MTPISDLHAAFDAQRNMIRPEVTRADYQHNAAIQAEIGRCETLALNAFAKLNGWKRVTSHMGFELSFDRPTQTYRGRKLAGYEYVGPLDHRRNFRCGRRAIAILGQPYDAPTDLTALPHVWGKLGGPDEVQLTWNIPPAPLASLYYPLATYVLVLARPETVVRWLPEQMDTERWAKKT